MTTGAGRLDRRLGVRVDVAVAFVAFDATGFRYFFAVGDSVIGVIHRNAAAFIRCHRAIRRLVTVQTLLHHFPIGVLLLVSVVAFLAIRRVFRLYVVSVMEDLDYAPSGILSPLLAISRISYAMVAHRHRLGIGRHRRRRRRRWRRRRPRIIDLTPSINLHWRLIIARLGVLHQQNRDAEMTRRRQRHAIGRARFDRLTRMTEAAFGAFYPHCAADVLLLHVRLVAWDATRRARLPAHRLSVLVEEFRADFSGLAGLVADQTALRALAERFFNRAERFTRIIIVVGHVSL